MREDARLADPRLLTPRQCEAMDAMCVHGSYKRASQAMGISERTLELHIRDAREKLRARNLINAVVEWTVYRTGGTSD